MKRKIIPVQIFEAEEGGYYATCTELGAYTQGDTIDELVRNIHEAVELSLEGENEDDTGFAKDSTILVNYEIGLSHAKAA